LGYSIAAASSAALTPSSRTMPFDTSTVRERFANQTVLISGAASGIGRALAQRLSMEGARLVLFGQTPGKLEAMAAELPGETLVVGGDASQLDDLDRLIERAKSRFGNLDGVVLSAAMAPLAPLEEIDDALFDSTFDLNVRGRFFLVQKALEILAPGSAVVMLSAAYVDRPFVGSSLFGASMAASRALARAWALELKDRGVRVCTVSPGPTDTHLYSGSLDTSAAAELKSALGSRTLRERLADTSEVAAAIAFLLGPDASFINGADLLVDGGFSLT
jgi:NAD(P)-dependent dehydrogenase (short-subunit alcohol dehydrogenase family)